MQTSRTNEPRPVISAVEAAKILGIPRTTLMSRIKAKSIETVGKLPGRTGSYLFDRAYIEEIAKREDALAASASKGSV